MLQMLLESAPRGRRSTRAVDAGFSFATHAAIIAVGIAVTAPATHRLVEAVTETHLMFVPHQPPPPATPRALPPTSVFHAPSHWVIAIPTVIPPTIPPIEPGPIRDETTIGNLTRLSTVTSPVGDSVSAGITIFHPNEVDRPVVAFPDNPAPRYPASLQAMGIAGDVVARFVVDTLGRVEPTSVAIAQSSHDLFERAVRDALSRARFHPAEWGGQRVRQLVEQRFAFSIRKP